MATERHIGRRSVVAGQLPGAGLVVDPRCRSFAANFSGPHCTVEARRAWSQKHHAGPACHGRRTRYGPHDGGMAQPHKGPREQVKTRVHAEVYAELRQLAAERGSSISQVAADLIATAVGRTDLVREVGEALPLAM